MVHCRGESSGRRKKRKQYNTFFLYKKCIWSFFLNMRIDGVFEWTTIVTKGLCGVNCAIEMISIGPWFCSDLKVRSEKKFQKTKIQTKFWSVLKQVLPLRLTAFRDDLINHRLCYYHGRTTVKLYKLHHLNKSVIFGAKIVLTNINEFISAFDDFLWQCDKFYWRLVSNYSAKHVDFTLEENLNLSKLTKESNQSFSGRIVFH